jgi:repressor LexA
VVRDGQGRWRTLTNPLKFQASKVTLERSGGIALTSIHYDHSRSLAKGADVLTKLTETQAKALEFIRTSIDKSGMAPTLRELCGHMGYSAVGSAQDVIMALRKKGFLLENDRQAARSYQLSALARTQRVTTSEGDFNTFVIPCLGTVPAGNPVEAVEDHIGTLRMSIALLPKPQPRPDELFALRARGDSMVGAGILDGDWLVVRLQKEAPKDSIVVARLDGDVTVKRLAHDKSGWQLKPENPRFQPILASQEPFEVIGRVVALQRAFD